MTLTLSIPEVKTCQDSMLQLPQLLLLPGQLCSGHVQLLLEGLPYLPRLHLFAIQLLAYT